MLNILNPFGTHSDFQKNRAVLTKINLEQSSDQAMKNIINTFRGEDQQTRAQIAFASIVKSLHTSASKNNWIFLIKNLIIFDRLVSQKCFCEQISSLSIPAIERYENQDSKASAIGASNILKSYWHLIKKISILKVQKKHIIFHKRCFRKEFLSTLNTHQVLQQIKILQGIFSNSYELITKICGTSIDDQENIRKTQAHSNKKNKNVSEIYNSKLAQYLIMHFYAKMLSYYSCQYLCIYRFIDILLHHTKTDKIIMEDVKKFSKMAAIFRLNSNDMIFINERHRHIKGFQHIDTKQFSAFSEESILKAVEEYLSQKNKLQQYKKKLQPLQLQNNSMNLTVGLKPFIVEHLNNSQVRTPRKKVNCPRDSTPQNQFFNYVDSTSEFFPNKNMMTLDLILQLRKQETQEKTQQFTDEQETLYDIFQKQKSRIQFHDILIWGRQCKKQKVKNKSENAPTQKKRSLFQCLNLQYTPNEAYSQ